MESREEEEVVRRWKMEEEEEERGVEGKGRQLGIVVERRGRKRVDSTVAGLGTGAKGRRRISGVVEVVDDGEEEEEGEKERAVVVGRKRKGRG